MKYFSGEATYRKTSRWDRGSISGTKWMLDLGRVQVMARVTLNGRDLGVVWSSRSGWTSPMP